MLSSLNLERVLIVCIPLWYTMRYFIYVTVYLYSIFIYLFIFFPMAQQPLFGCLGLFISRFHDHTH
jgi:hypothetical protein